MVRLRPADSEKKRRRAAHEARVTPIGYGNRPGTKKSALPKRQAGKRYTVAKLPPGYLPRL